MKRPMLSTRCLYSIVGSFVFMSTGTHTMGIKGVKSRNSRPNRRPSSQVTIKKGAVLPSSLSADIAGILESDNGTSLKALLSTDTDCLSQSAKTDLLFRAMKSNKWECVKVLLEAGVPVSVKNSDGWTPLHFASFSGNVECIKLLLGAGASVNSSTRLNMLPIHYAACSGCADCVELLLEAGSPINSQDRARCTPLHCAAHGGQIECVMVLLKAGASRSPTDWAGLTALQAAQRKGHIECVKAFTKSGF